MTQDEALIEALKADWTTAPITDAERAMLVYTVKLTKTPWEMTREDLDPLRAQGFDDQAIVQINLIASYFNYINRVADGLGVGR